MKKFLLLLSVFVISLNSFGQIPIDTALVRQNADKWFKENYVEKTYKDPYSYKPLKTTVVIVTIEQEVLETISFLKTKEWSLKYNADSSNSMLKFYKEQQEKYTEKSKKKNSMQKFNQEQVDYYAKRVIEERNKIIDAQTKLDEYNKLVQSLYNGLEELTEEEKMSFGYYRIYHDAHGNNSYGNQILGRYKYKFNTITNLGSEVEDIK